MSRNYPDHGGTTRTGLVIASLKRLTNSVYGNPRYHVYFTDGTSAVTQSDISDAYGITNPEYRDAPLAVTYTRAGRIARIKPETAPMKPGELGRYVCVLGCLHSPRTTIRSDGVWVKPGPGALVSSAHRDCYEAYQLSKR